MPSEINKHQKDEIKSSLDMLLSEEMTDKHLRFEDLGLLSYKTFNESLVQPCTTETCIYDKKEEIINAINKNFGSTVKYIYDYNVEKYHIDNDFDEWKTISGFKNIEEFMNELIEQINTATFTAKVESKDLMRTLSLYSNDNKDNYNEFTIILNSTYNTLIGIIEDDKFPDHHDQYTYDLINDGYMFRITYETCLLNENHDKSMCLKDNNPDNLRTWLNITLTYNAHKDKPWGIEQGKIYLYQDLSSYTSHQNKLKELFPDAKDGDYIDIKPFF